VAVSKTRRWTIAGLLFSSGLINYLDRSIVAVALPLIAQDQQGKLVADQLGHSLDVNQNVYTKSPVERRKVVVNQLERTLVM